MKFPITWVILMSWYDALSCNLYCITDMMGCVDVPYERFSTMVLVSTMKLMLFITFVERSGSGGEIEGDPFQPTPIGMAIG